MYLYVEQNCSKHAYSVLMSYKKYFTEDLGVYLVFKKKKSSFKINCI